MDAVAESFVRLALALGRHDEGYVDAYYGPPAWREDAARIALPLSEIRARAAAALGDLDVVSTDGGRRAHLVGQLRALAGRASLLAGASMSFDEESELLYGVVAPHRSPSDYEPVLAELDSLLPGSGDLTSRYTAYVDRFLVPSDKIAVALDTAIAEARRRTVAEIDLPPNEGVDVAYVDDRPWAAQNHYQGDARSQIIVNTDNPLQLDGILDLACHEGYPGHHVFGVVVERDLVRGKGWLEFTLTVLHSPMALIAEGTAMFAVEVAFPGEERLAYEREVLCPLTGLDPGDVARYDRVRELARRLDHAANDVARGYIDGELDAAAAMDQLASCALMSPERARRRLRAVETYRSYVINYTVGKDVARAYLHTDPAASRWRTYEAMLRSPWLVGTTTTPAGWAANSKP